MIDTYVACSMTSMPTEEYDVFRHDILRVCDVLDSKQMSSYREPYEFDIDKIDTPAQALQKNIDVLENMKFFVLVYTHKTASSALIELGYAWKLGVPIYVFAKEGVSLPFYLRDKEALLKYKIQIHYFNDLSTLPELVKEVI